MNINIILASTGIHRHIFGFQLILTENSQYVKMIADLLNFLFWVIVRFHLKPIILDSKEFLESTNFSNLASCGKPKTACISVI